MDRSSPYYKAHVLVAAVRLITHQKQVAPSVDQLAEATAFSLEQVHWICNDLQKRGVLQIVRTGMAERIYVQDPLPLEEIPKEKKGLEMEKEIKRFESERRAQMERITSLKSQDQKRKKDLFAALDEQLKISPKSK